MNSILENQIRFLIPDGSSTEMSAIRGGGERHVSKAEDWTCPACSTANFLKRHRCNKCGAVKPKASKPTVDGGGHADASTTLRKGDWFCTGCQNVNWARRDKCNICFTPKPVSLEQEEIRRTGRGGGHNDLQDPDDRVKHNSDDEEYDEFGRKKKIKKQQAHSVLKTTGVGTSLELDDRERILERARAEGVILSFPPAPISESSDDDAGDKPPARKPRLLNNSRNT